MHIALVSAEAARGLDQDEPPLASALKSAGARVEVVNWDHKTVDWSKFDIALLRSAWDYTARLPEFLLWAERASALTTLLNPLPIVRWNTDKHYLATLAEAGVPIIPTDFIEPGDDAGRALAAFLSSIDAAEFVVKPAVGAGSRDVFRYAREDEPAAAIHAQRLVNEKRSVVLQPYLDKVDQDGETALVFFAGQFSHAICKAAILRRGNVSVTTELFAPEKITPRLAGADEIRIGAQALAAIPFEQPLYGRVDLIRGADGAPRVLELELTEPSVFLSYSPGSADRFAKAILASAFPFSPTRSSQGA